MEEREGTIMPSKSKQELERISINLPVNLVNRVKEYAEETGLNVTSAYISLISQALRQNDAITNLPMLLAAMDEMKKLSNNETNGKEE